MDRQIVCVTAGQRSGTTALRSFISGTGVFADLGEIFDTSIQSDRQSYFGYCRNRAIQVADIMTGPDTEALCKDYISTLQQISSNRHILIDVKFNSWGEIRMPWTYMHQEPFFLSQLKWARAKFIFVWRRDLVAQILSDRVSDRIGKWHNLDAGDAIAPFELDVERMRGRATLLCMSEQYYFQNLSNYSDTVFLCYEELYGGADGLSSAAQAAISGLVGEPLRFSGSSPYVKNTLNHRSLIANYAEVVAAIEDAVEASRDARFRT